MFISPRRRVAALALGVVVGLSGLGNYALAQRDGDDGDGDTTEQDFEVDVTIEAISVELSNIL
ncbi:MAG: hypothetical protein ACRDZ3_09080, partial [Acidimicrobiia bacterium]